MNKFRGAIVFATAIVSVVVLSKSLAYPTIRSTSISKFVFPKSIPLSQSQLVFSGAVNPYLVQTPAYIAGDFIAGKHYRYLYDEKYLDIEIRYLNNTNGDLKSFITSQTGELLPMLKENSNGFYSIYNDENKVYLSACINSRGGSTVTNDQFNRNRLTYDLRFTRLIKWLLGKKDLKDRRCIWTHISIALDNNTHIEKTYKDLEEIWTDWHTWWQVNFPN